MNKVMVALITPFTEDNKVDYHALDHLITRLLKEGCDGFIVCGTTAETPTLSKHERYTILRHVIRKTRKRAEIWFGCGNNDTEATLQNALEASKEEIDGVLLVTPYYNRPSQEGIYQHFHYIAQRTSCPIMIYNIPSRTGVELHIDTLRRLIKDHPSITALKHASHDLKGIAQLKHDFPDFQIYSGEDGYFDEGIAQGMDGLISVMGHVFLPQIKAFLCDERRDHHLYRQLQQAAAYTFLEPSPAPVKYMLMLRGECEHRLRLPMTPLSKDGIQKIDQWLTNSDSN